MKTSKGLVIFPSSVNSPFSEWDLQTFDVTALLTSWQGRSNPQFVTEPGG